MDGNRFDQITKLIVSKRTRRGFAGLLSAGVLAVMPLGALASTRKRVDGSVCSMNADCESAFCTFKDRQGRRLCSFDPCARVQGDDGEMFCSGAGFCTIDHGVGVYRDCAPGTFCFEAGPGAIVCDFRA